MNPRFQRSLSYGRTADHLGGDIDFGVRITKAGAEISTNEGPTIGAAVSGHAGAASGEVKVDTNGVHTSGQIGADKDIKLGGHAQIVVGVGITVNLSQAARAAEHAMQSGLALANYLVNRFMPSGPLF